MAAATQAGKTLKVHVLSDSATTVSGGNSLQRRHAYPLLWGLLDNLQQQGLDVVFHRIPRESVGLHIFIDRLSKQARIRLKDVQRTAVEQMQVEFPGLPDDLNAYDMNP